MDLKKHKRVDRALRKRLRRLYPGNLSFGLIIWADLDDAIAAVAEAGLKVDPNATFTLRPDSHECLFPEFVQKAVIA